jgi:hypothetical protein
MNRTRLIAAFSTLAWATCANAQKELTPALPDEAKTATPLQQAGDPEDIAMKYYQSRVEQAFLAKPHLFESMRNLNSNRNEAMLQVERDNLAKRRREEIDARNVPTISVGMSNPLADLSGVKGSVTLDYMNKEMATHAMQQRRAMRDEETLREMATDAGSQAVRSLAHDITAAEYKARHGKVLSEGEKNLLKHFDDAIIPDSGSIPRSPGNLDTLMANDKHPETTLAQLGYTADQIKQIKDGKNIGQAGQPVPPTPQQLTAQLYKLTNNITVSTLNVKLAETSSNTKADLATLEQREDEIDLLLANPSKHSIQEIFSASYAKASIETLKKQARLREHDSDVKGMREYGDAIFSVSGLLTQSRDVQQAWTGYKAATEIYNAVGRMVINGALDPTGITAIAGGLGVITSLFGSHGDSNAEMFGMLQEILKNQQKIIHQLDELKGKVDLLDRKVSKILSNLEELSASNRVGFDAVRADFARATANFEEIARADTQAVLEQGTIEQYKTDLEVMTSPAHDAEYQACFTTNQCASVQGKFDKLEEDAITLKNMTMGRLVKEPYYKLLDINEKNAGELKELLHSDLSSRNGLLVSSQIFLNSKVGQATTFKLGNESILAQQPPATLFTTSYIPLYSELITHLPRMYGQHQASIQALDAQLQRLDAAAHEMRSNIPLANEAFLSASIGMARRMGEWLYRLAAARDFQEEQFQDFEGFDRFPLVIDDEIADAAPEHTKNRRFYRAPNYVSRLIPIEESVERMTSKHQSIPPYAPPSPPPVTGIGNKPRFKIPDLRAPNASWSVLRKVVSPSKNVTLYMRGLMFAGYSSTEIRDFVHDLSDGEFWYLGETIGAFRHKSTEERQELAPTINGHSINSMITETISLAPSQVSIDHLLQGQTSPLKEDSSYAMVRIARHTSWSTKSGTYEVLDKHVSFPNDGSDKRKAWETLLVAYAEYAQDEITKGLRSKATTGPIGSDADQTLQSLSEDLLRGALVLNTYVRAGMGQCLDTSPDLADLRDLLKFSNTIVEETANMAKAPSFQDLFKSYSSVAGLITKISGIRLPQLSDLENHQATAACDLGWGNLDLARRSLDRARSYDEALAGRSSNPK